MHHFHGQPPQNRSTKSKKLWFGPLQLCLSAHVLHFFKIFPNILMIFVTHFFHIFKVKEVKKIYIMPQFHVQRSQNISTKSKKLWFGSLQLWLSSHVSNFFEIMSNTLMIFVRHFSLMLMVKESKKKILCTGSLDNHLKIGARNRKNYYLDTCN